MHDKPDIAPDKPEFMVGVVAHPQRVYMATKLTQTVGADLLSYDDGPPADTLTGCARNHINVLQQLTNSAYWICVLEDDAVVAPKFREHLAGLLQYAPTPVVGLYLGTGAYSRAQQEIRKAVSAAKESGDSWIVADCLIGSVGYVVHDAVVPDMLDFIANRDTEELPLRITRWAQHRSIAVAYTMPSLVDHEDGESVGRPFRAPGFPARRAWYFGVRDEWNTRCVKLGYIPVWSKEF